MKKLHATSFGKKKKKIQTTYFCNYCDFSTTIKKDAITHLTTKQHIQNESKEEEILEIVQQYICTNCDTSYNKYKSCWEHSKRCQGKKENIIVELTEILPESLVPETAKPSLETNLGFNSASLRDAALKSPSTEFQKKDAMEILVEKIIDISNKQMMENNKLMEQILNAVKSVLTQSNHVTTNNTNNNTNCNNTNQQFNLNFFLNETCKNAINFSDFIENIQVSSDDLENNAKMGFVNGMTKLIVDNLKQMELNVRPIHCTDVKRETIYVKEEDQWDKENSNKVIQRGIQDITCKNMQQLCQWREENPEYTDYDSGLSDLSMVMQQNSMAGPKRDEFYSKIIKNIAKDTILDKKIMV